MCEIETNNSKIVLKDDDNKNSRTQCIINNKKRDIFYKVNLEDKKMRYPSGKKRCDYLVMDEKRDIGMYIELKGRNWEDSIKQFEHSIEEIENLNNRYLEKKFNKRYCLVVTTKSPVTPRQQWAKMRLRQRRADLKIKTNKAEIVDFSTFTLQ